MNKPKMLLLPENAENAQCAIPITAIDMISMYKKSNSNEWVCKVQYGQNYSTISSSRPSIFRFYKHALSFFETITMEIDIK